MGARGRPTGDELAARRRAWADAWFAAGASTEPADRPRAEAAIRALYELSGRPAPEIRWAPSPRAGMLAYAYASISQAGVRNPLTRGDIGNGLNREFNALAEPFGLGRVKTARLDSRARGLSVGANVRPLATLTAALAEASLPLPQATGGDASDVAAGVLGESWHVLVGSLGEEIAGRLFGDALRTIATELLAAPRLRRDARQAMQPGQWDTVMPVLAAARDVYGEPIWHRRADRERIAATIDHHLDIARSAGPWWALECLAVVSERPLVRRVDDVGRPHAANGPALAWPDGFEVYAWHGVVVEPPLILDPGSITIAMIDAEQNQERRRILIERFGEERLIREGAALLVDEDETGRLWRRDLPRAGWWAPRDEPVAMVEVVNATPEPDGSRKTYFLRVPPYFESAHQAVAWTFGLGSVDYHPTVET